MPGARCARSLACEIKKHTSIVTTVTPVSPGIPCAMVYGLFRALPGDRAFLPPSPAKVAFRELDASVGASGPHGFAVRVRHVRPRAVSVHRIPPRVDDVAQRPSMGRDGEGYRFDLGQRRRGIFFRRGLDTPQSEKRPDLPVGQISRGLFQL